MSSNQIKLAVCFIAGIVLWWLPHPSSITDQAWQIFAVFITVIFCFVLRPVPIGMSVFVGLIILVTSNTITIAEGLSGFADSTVWLVISAFLLAAAVIGTGLGERIAYTLVSRLGKSVKGLAYAICGSEIILATVVPSNTARGGGIHAPIVNSLSHSMNSYKGKNPERVGSYLTLVGGHANLIAASTFMTGMAANPLISKAAKDVFNVDFGWGTWALGAVIPALVSMLLLPHLIYFLQKPTIDDVAKARTEAVTKLKEKGPMTRNEWIMAAVLVGMLLLWSTKFAHGLGTTIVALCGVGVLLITNAQSWDDVIKNHLAWDALVWLGGLLSMANLLLKYGFIDWFVGVSGELVSGMSGTLIAVLLALIYFYSMYGFSMLTAHIAAMAAPFFAVCLAAGSEPMLVVALFAYFSCLCGCLTNYSSGPVIIYFGLGYVKAPKWFRVGFVVSLAHIVVWLGFGMIWWKILGWW